MGPFQETRKEDIQKVDLHKLIGKLEEEVKKGYINDGTVRKIIDNSYRFNKKEQKIIRKIEKSLENKEYEKAIKYSNKLVEEFNVRKETTKKTETKKIVPKKIKEQKIRQQEEIKELEISTNKEIEDIVNNKRLKKPFETILFAMSNPLSNNYADPSNPINNFEIVKDMLDSYNLTAEEKKKLEQGLYIVLDMVERGYWPRALEDYQGYNLNFANIEKGVNEFKEKINNLGIDGFINEMEKSLNDFNNFIEDSSKLSFNKDDLETYREQYKKNKGFWDYYTQKILGYNMSFGELLDKYEEILNNKEFIEKRDQIVKKYASMEGVLEKYDLISQQELVMHTWPGIEESARHALVGTSDGEEVKIDSASYNIAMNTYIRELDKFSYLPRSAHLAIIKYTFPEVLKNWNDINMVKDIDNLLIINGKTITVRYNDISNLALQKYYSKVVPLAVATYKLNYWRALNEELLRNPNNTAASYRERGYNENDNIRIQRAVEVELRKQEERLNSLRNVINTSDLLTGVNLFYEPILDPNYPTQKIEELSLSKYFTRDEIRLYRQAKYIPLRAITLSYADFSIGVDIDKIGIPIPLRKTSFYKLGGGAYGYVESFAGETEGHYTSYVDAIGVSRLHADLSQSGDTTFANIIANDISDGKNWNLERGELRIGDDTLSLALESYQKEGIIKGNTYLYLDKQGDKYVVRGYYKKDGNWYRIQYQTDKQEVEDYLVSYLSKDVDARVLVRKGELEGAFLVLNLDDAGVSYLRGIADESEERREVYGIFKKIGNYTAGFQLFRGEGSRTVVAHKTEKGYEWLRFATSKTDKYGKEYIGSFQVERKKFKIDGSLFKINGKEGGSLGGYINVGDWEAWGMATYAENVFGENAAVVGLKKDGKEIDLIYYKNLNYIKENALRYRDLKERIRSDSEALLSLEKEYEITEDKEQRARILKDILEKQADITRAVNQAELYFDPMYLDELYGASLTMNVEGTTKGLELLFYSKDDQNSMLANLFFMGKTGKGVNILFGSGETKYLGGSIVIPWSEVTTLMAKMSLFKGDGTKINSIAAGVESINGDKIVRIVGTTEQGEIKLDDKEIKWIKAGGAYEVEKDGKRYYLAIEGEKREIVAIPEDSLEEYTLRGKYGIHILDVNERGNIRIRDARIIAELKKVKIGDSSRYGAVVGGGIEWKSSYSKGNLEIKIGRIGNYNILSINGKFEVIF